LLHDNVGDRDDLLLCGFEVAGLLGHRAEFLDRIHQFFRLINKSRPEIDRRGQVRIHLGDQLRELGDCFDVVVPRLSIQLRNVVRVFHEPGGLDNFKRIR
jgi:hypothetical protein